MEITAFKTSKVRSGHNLYSILNKYLPKLEEKDIVVITSKIISISQGRVIKNDGKITKQDLVKKESQYYLPEKYVKYGVHPTITNNVFIVSAGIDESNANGHFVLWPKNVMNETTNIWRFLRNRNKVRNLGIIVTDSHLSPLRRGTTGFGIAWCGFEPLKNYIGKPDIFGRKLKLTKSNIVDGLAASAVLVIGEGSEQTPLAIIKDVSFVRFKQKPPSEREINQMTIPLEDDVFSSLLTSVKWKKGKGT